jgi:hypothetical protein
MHLVCQLHYLISKGMGRIMKRNLKGSQVGRDHSLTTFRLHLRKTETSTFHLQLVEVLTISEIGGCT